MLIGNRPSRTAISVAVATALVGSGNALAQDSKRKIEEITVTATKVEESLQDVPIAVHALTGEALQELGITNFSDYVMQLPSVTAGGSGPGQNTIYIRGVASTTPNLTTAGVAGLAPNVAFYLDEQPLAQPGRNLDVYAADLKRIEVLSGPQGTLFGGSSQAGNVRLISNKPDLGDTYGSVRVGAATISDGDAGGNIEVMFNLPVSETFGLRGVFYTDTKGGWIDNVAGTRDASQSARFRPEGALRLNGVPVSADRAGFQSTADLSGVTFLDADNSSLVEEDFNETTYTGGRISARWEVSDKLRLDFAHTQQDLESDGVFFSDPSVGDLAVERFSPDKIEDTFGNTSWTAEAFFGELEVLYTGAFTDRETDQVVDYTDYLFVGQYLPYYICDYYVTYTSFSPTGIPDGTCQAPNLFVASGTDVEVISHEIRFTTDQAKAFRVTAGAFFQDLELKELNDFTYPGSVNATSYADDGMGGRVLGFGPNYPLTNIAVTGEVGNASAGYFSEPGPFPAGVIFRNDVKRTDEQLGIFGEATYDFTDEFALTFGLRYYDIEVDFEGSANSSFFNFGQSTDAQAFGTNISAQFAPDNTLGAPDKAVADGTIFKLTGNWRPNDDHMYYLTISEGFRPGLLNRPGGSTNPAGTFTVPYALDTDDVTNFELGAKGTYLDGSFQLNAALFFVDIENLQTTIFDPSITNLFFSDNAANAEVLGLEGDFVWLPEFSDRLTVTGAFSFLSTEITDVLTPTNDVIKGDELAFAPEFQGTLRARYAWDFGTTGMMAHVMPSVSWSSEAFSDIITINRDKMDSWVMASVSAGLSKDSWDAEIYINNLTDERAEVARNFVFDRTTVTYAQPLTFGVRANFHF
ncbi:MAG: TonB-dependent receptor [Gammaproteobacteria bacterium]|nr:TonB-dependent receptor [Gammaproteobacteria bacterium]